MSTFAQVLKTQGYSDAEIAAAEATHIDTADSPGHTTDQLDSAVLAHIRTATTAEELRALLNPTDQSFDVHADALSPQAQRAAGRVSSAQLRALLEAGDRAAARGQAMAVTLGTPAQVQAFGPSVEAVALPMRVTAVAAASLIIRAGDAHVLGNQSAPSQPFVATYDTLVIESGGQLVLASPTTLTVTGRIGRTLDSSSTSLATPRATAFVTDDGQTPNISSVGSSGASGNPGNNGQPGSTGGNGSNGVDGSCGKCTSQPTNGGNGGSGTSGTAGTNGAAGSDAPNVTFQVASISGDFLVFTGGGNGGGGGKGGNGGGGGNGGQPGSTTGNCTTAASQGTGGNGGDGGNGGNGGDGGNGGNVTILYGTNTGNVKAENPASSGGAGGAGGSGGSGGSGRTNGSNGGGGHAGTTGTTGKSGTVNIIQNT